MNLKLLLLLLIKILRMMVMTMIPIMVMVLWLMKSFLHIKKKKYTYSNIAREMRATFQTHQTILIPEIVTPVTK